MRTLATGLATEIAKRGRSMARVHLFDVQRYDGTNYFWSSLAGNYLSTLTGAMQTYSEWVKEAPTIKLSRSLAADGGEFKLQNLSGNTIGRDVAAMLKAGEFEGAYCIYRPWFIPLDAAAFEFHGYLTEQQASDDEVILRILQLFNPNDIPAYDFRQTMQCHFRYRSGQCGMRRGTLFVPLTTADIFSASTIGKSSLSLISDLYKDELVMIVAGTGAGQERFILTHTATTFTLKSNWTTNPDATSQFITTGPGTMKVAATLADIFSSVTIGNSGLTRTADQDKDELVIILSGTGAGQERHITTNTATTFTVTPAWTTVPDASSRFIVVFRSCPKDRASCVNRGVVERFPGIIHLTSTITQNNGPTGQGSGGGAGGGSGGSDDPLGGGHPPRALP